MPFLVQACRLKKEILTQVCSRGNACGVLSAKDEQVVPSQNQIIVQWHEYTLLKSTLHTCATI